MPGASPFVMTTSLRLNACPLKPVNWAAPPETSPKKLPRTAHSARTAGSKGLHFTSRSFGVYEGALVRSVLLLQYEQIELLGKWFARHLAESAPRECDSLAADMVVPVPLHRLRQRERGFNQVDLFGQPLAKLPYRPVLLTRATPRSEKHLLGNEERREAVRGAFAIREGGRVDNLRVLLLDDVMTTGATLDACARALREAGARTIAGLTIARAIRSASPVTGDS